MSYSFDELFAIRLQFQDFTFDESLIIKKLKNLLLQNNMPIDEINVYLVDFYNQFGITISLEDMISVNITNNIPENQEENQEEIQEENQEEIQEENQEENQIDLTNFFPIIGDTFNFNIPIANESTPEQNLEVNDNNLILPEEDSNSLNENIFNESQPEIPQNISSTYSYTFNIPLGNSNSFQQLNHFSSIFNNILNIPPPPPQEPQEDIQVTLDDECLNKLETVEVENASYDRCTICLCDIEKGEKIIKLTCSHYFHEECLKEYLEEYDYKCPICRVDVGKSKAHV